MTTEPAPAALSITRDAPVAALWTPTARVGRLVAAEWAWLLAGVDVDEVPDDVLSPDAPAVDGVVTAGDVGDLVARIDLDRLADGLRADATPVPALVAQLRELVPAARDHLHVGLTSQDVVDTATMLGLAASLDVLSDLVQRAGDRCAVLARAHRDTPMRGRTLLQPANRTTFGLRAASWLAGLDGNREGLARAGRRLALSWGGPVGTGAGQSPGRVTAWGLRLDLPVPMLPWHGNRARIHELAGLLATVAGQVASRSRDVVLLGQAELDEVSDRAAGGSSSMPDKRNPAAAVQALAAARVASAAAGGLLAGTEVELDRAAGTWQAEADLLEQLVVATGAALAHDLRSLTSLEVQAQAMAARAGDDDPGRAGELVDHAVAAWDTT